MLTLVIFMVKTRFLVAIDASIRNHFADSDYMQPQMIVKSNIFAYRMVHSNCHIQDLKKLTRTNFPSKLLSWMLVLFNMSIFTPLLVTFVMFWIKLHFFVIIMCTLQIGNHTYTSFKIFTNFLSLSQSPPAENNSNWYCVNPLWMPVVSDNWNQWLVIKIPLTSDWLPNHWLMHSPKIIRFFAN